MNSQVELIEKKIRNAELVPEFDFSKEPLANDCAKDKNYNKILIEKQKSIGNGILCILKIHDPNAAIAGGAARDWYLNMPASDIDFFFYLDPIKNGIDDIEEEEYYLDFIKSNFPFLQDISVLEGYLPSQNIDVLANPPDIKDTKEYENFYVIEGNYVQEDFTQKLQFVISSSQRASEICKNFHLSISQIYYTDDEFYYTELFDWTVKNKCMILMGNEYSIEQKYIKKIRNKFSYYDFLSINFLNQLSEKEQENLFVYEKDAELCGYEYLWKVAKEVENVEKLFDKALKLSQDLSVKTHFPFLNKNVFPIV